jgi:CBS domain-containing protein
MLIREVMTKEVISVSPDSSVEQVAQLLIGNKIHGVPVVENGKPVGMITETDFFTKGSVTIYLPQYIDFLKKGPASGKVPQGRDEKVGLLLNTKAKDIMSSPCVTISSDEDVSEFFKLVREKKMISVPVVDHAGILVGIVTLADIINLININA